jgi:hypothetical protein
VSARSSRSDAVVDGLRDWGIEVFVHVPSSHVAPVIQGLETGGVRGVLADLLRAAGIRAERLGPAQSAGLWRRTTTAVAELAVMTHRPIALLMDVMHPATAEDLA